MLLDITLALSCLMGSVKKITDLGKWDLCKTKCVLGVGGFLRLSLLHVSSVVRVFAKVTRFTGAGSMRLRLSSPWDLRCLGTSLLLIHHCQENIVVVKLLAGIVFPFALYRLEEWDLSMAVLFINNSDNYSQIKNVKAELSGVNIHIQVLGQSRITVSQPTVQTQFYVGF